MYNLENLAFHVLSRDEPYRSRLIDIGKRCSDVHDFDVNFFDPERFIFDDKHKVVMCVVPKV